MSRLAPATGLAPHAASCSRFIAPGPVSPCPVLLQPRPHPMNGPDTCAMCLARGDLHPGYERMESNSAMTTSNGANRIPSSLTSPSRPCDEKTIRPVVSPSGRVVECHSFSNTTKWADSHRRSKCAGIASRRNASSSVSRRRIRLARSPVTSTDAGRGMALKLLIETSWYAPVSSSARTSLTRTSGTGTAGSKRSPMYSRQSRADRQSSMRLMVPLPP